MPILLTLRDIPAVKFDFNRDTDTARGTAEELVAELQLPASEVDVLTAEITKQIAEYIGK